MNVYVYMDDWGKWCVSHRPPTDCTYLLVALPPGPLPIFIDDQTREVEISV